MKNQKDQNPIFDIRISIGGYTLLEILVVLAVTAILTSFIFSYSTTAREQVILSIERAKILQQILRAKSLSISTFNNPDVPCAWGVHLDYGAQTYALASYSTSTCGGIADVSSITAISQNFPLDPAVIYAAGANRVEDILFIPPDPTVLLFVNGNTTTSQGFVYISAANGSATSAISVSDLGQISY